MWLNYALECAILANILAQVIKVPLHLLMKRQWQPMLIFSTGGMPSSHSAFVAALTTAVAVLDGFHSTTFAISFCLASVVIYDAMGISRHAGEHAKLLNHLIDDLVNSGNVLFFQDKTYQTKLKELLGHEPLETLAGTLFGIAIALIYGWCLHLI